MERGKVVRMQAKEIARWVALLVLFLVPFTPLIVANSYFFPFITGKAFFFRILIEVAVGAWAVLALLDKAYRPRFSWIFAAVLAFVAWMFVADIAAMNVNKAFWSNFERMEGWVWLAHLLGFFVAASAVLRVEGKWRAWFLTSLGVSVLLVFHALLQLAGLADIHQSSTRVDSSLGNSAYFAVYLLLNTFIAGWLALTEERVWLKRFLLALAATEAFLVFFTETRGAILGLVGALFLAALLTLLTAGGRARRVAVGACALIVLLVGTFYLSRNSAFVEENRILNRIASISLEDGRVRFTIWGMAFEGFKERPVLGWGQEGFNYVFNKYYEPSLYAQEPWFDRAHNAFIDWLMAGGLPAFLLYLSLFLFAVAALWRNSTLSRAERIALTSALAGYACHNFFVFDNLYSYIYFFAILAFIDSQVSRPIPFFERGKTLSSEHAGAAFAAAAAVVLVLIYMVNITGMRAAKGLIVAITPPAEAAGLEENLRKFEEITSREPFALQEIREQLVSFSIGVVGNTTIPESTKQKFAALALSEMQKQNQEHPGDARTLLQLSAAYRTAGDAERALDALAEAAAFSPEKPQILVQAAGLRWGYGDFEGARSDLEKAYALAPGFEEVALYAATANILAKDKARAAEILQEAFGTTTVANDILAVAYEEAKAFDELIALLTLRIGSPEADLKTWFELARAYFLAGDRAGAVATLERARAVFPEREKEIQAAILEVRNLKGSQ